MNATATRIPLTMAIEQERNAIRSSWSRKERERRRATAEDKQRQLVELLLSSGQAERINAA